MIHFNPDVHIDCFTNWLMPILINTSMWSNLYHKSVVICSVDSTPLIADPGYCLGLKVKMDVDTGRPEDRQKLYTYLAKTLPTFFVTACDGAHVHVVRGVV